MQLACEKAIALSIHAKQNQSKLWLAGEATHIQQACVEHLWHQKKQISNVCKKHAPKKHISFCNFLHCIHTKLSFAKAFSIKENGCSFPTYLFGFLFLLEHVKHICCVPATHIYIYIYSKILATFCENFTVRTFSNYWTQKVNFSKNNYNFN